MKRSILLFLSTIVAAQGFGQAAKKTNVEYAEQKAIANDVATKSKVVPFAIPDWNSMVSLNESGDGIVNIPLATIRGRKLTLPIALTYVTSGIKVDQNSSEVGLGWSIGFGSIRRDYGAYEPDYTYTGKETNMSNTENLPDGWLFTNRFNSGQTTGTQFPFLPANQNKNLKYFNVDNSYTPDLYQVNIPGRKSNSFWNKARDVDASFVFSEKEAIKVEYEKQTIVASQEPSAVNEWTYQSDLAFPNRPSPSTKLMNTHNLSAAIGLYPYVKNQKVENYVTDDAFGASIGRMNLGMNDQNGYQMLQAQGAKVEYEDYSKFILTQVDGTKYIFGRTLRGQKYLFDEEPFWSAISGTTLPNLNNICKGELWKTDYIAEWLLTEVRSNDFVDVNNNGIADDGDNGDWIKIEYTKPYRYEVPFNMPVPFKIPMHREWMNFTQTDRASSLMREVAYVTKITTPIQTVDFANSERFDVNHDYFKRVFNRMPGYANEQYIYNITKEILGPISVNAEPENYDRIPNSDIKSVVEVEYPVETRRYDDLKIKENISGESKDIQQVKLLYADKGSANELAVSNYLIIDNNKSGFDYDPLDLQTTLTRTNFYRSTGRGKTTLLGIEFHGSTVGQDKIAFEFQYNFNPKFDDLHLFHIYQQAASPAIRESSRVITPRWSGRRSLPESPHNLLPNSILPWKTLEINEYSNLTQSQFDLANVANSEGAVLKTTEAKGNVVRSDELSYFVYPSDYTGATSVNGVALKGRDAWSLSSIKLPYGGKINIKYGLDETDINMDRMLWRDTVKGIADYTVPSVGVFNNIVHLRNVAQSKANRLSSYRSNLKKLNSEYYFLLNEKSGGLRVDKIEYEDQFTGKKIAKDYRYGKGHFTVPPSEFWQNYFSGFSSFLYNTRVEQEYERYTNPSQVAGFTDFVWNMMRLCNNTRVDQSIRQQSKHYYEYIEEVNNDGGHTRTYYGKLFNSADNCYFINGTYVPSGSNNNTDPFKGLAKHKILPGSIKPDMGDRVNFVELLTTNVDQRQQVGNYRTDYFNANGNLVKSESHGYDFALSESNNVTLKENELTFNTYPIYSPESTYDVVGTNTNPMNWLQDVVLTPEDPELNIKSFYATLDPQNAKAVGYWAGNTLVPRPNGPRIYNYDEYYIDVKATAVSPLSKLAFTFNVFPAANMPSWFQSIVQSGNPLLANTQGHIPSLTDMTNSVSGMFTFMRDHYKDYYFKDVYYKVQPVNYSSHASYYLRPTHTRTLINF